MSKERETTKKNQSDNLVIVGIGASAGGLEALRALIPSLPVQKNMTYVIAQHMDPKHSSMLGAILERDTDIPIQEIEHGQTLQSSVLNIVPPGMHAYMKGIKVFLQKATGIGPKPSIDRFFVSLAEERGERSVGIILSGTGSDGAHGIPAIKAKGGITIAQDETTAKFSSMPYSAINTGHVDLILSPDKIGAQLPDFIRYPRVLPETEEEVRPTDYLSRILRLILEHTGGDFRDYKVSTIGRRIERRMAVHKLYEISEYVTLLEKQPEECVELYQDILIPVTDFFRDKSTFSLLSKYFQRVIDKDSDNIRIWVAGCATGQEAYSIAILLSEYLGAKIHRYHVQIFATDLDEDALVIARQGIYPKVAIEQIDKKLLDKYFDRQQDTWQLNASIREMVMFAKHSLVKDPPFSHLDLVSCRNVLIYFNTNLQKRVLQTFHYALKDKGLLFLGKSETTGACEHLFMPLALRERFYGKRNEVKPQLPCLIPIASGTGTSTYQEATQPPQEKHISSTDQLNNMLASIYKPDCVLLDARLDVIYIRGDVKPFLTFGDGKVGLNVCDLVHTELRHDLRALLYKAKREDGIVRGRKFQLDIHGVPTSIRLLVRYFEQDDTDEKTLLVFEHQSIEDDDLTTFAAQPVDHRRIRALEEELRETRESLQTTIEELETSNEELQSTYEEAQSTNEELYTSSEELQTSNEELQSTNEELRTVNQEVAVKSAEIEASNIRLKQEVEERRRAEHLFAEQEKKLRMIINSEPAWVNICDSQGVIIEVNPAGIEIMEADSKENLVGRKLLDLVMDEDKDKMQACQGGGLQAGETRKQTVAVKTLKGNMRWLEISTVRLPNEADHHAQIMSIICDQTQFKHTHDKLLKGQAELAQVMRFNTLGAMASGLAHELNQPLSAISNYLSGCERRVRGNNCEQEEVLDVLHLTNIQVQRAGEIINHVKNFIKQDKLVDTEVVDMNSTIDSAVELARGTGQCNHAQIELDLASSLMFVRANKVQIEQVIINLLLNGVEAMDDAGIAQPKLFIRTRLVGQEQVEVLVEDSGKGLSTTEKMEIFKPFHTTKAKGMGMGLCVSRSIIELYTGQLSVLDRAGGGTIFKFSLPVYA